MQLEEPVHISPRSGTRPVASVVTSAQRLAETVGMFLREEALELRQVALEVALVPLHLASPALSNQVAKVLRRADSLLQPLCAARSWAHRHPK